MAERQNLPAWQRNSRFLDEVKGLRNPLQLLEADSHEPEIMEQAIRAWAAIDVDVKEYINARIAYNLLVGIDELRRRLDRGNNHLSNIRTGTRLTAERVEALNRSGSFMEDEDEDTDFIDFGNEGFDEVDEGDMPPIPMGVDRGPDAPFTDEDEAELAEAFIGLDESPAGVFVAQEPELPAPPPKRKASPPKRKASPRKRKPAAKKPASKKASSRKSNNKDNGVGTSVEVLDEDGTPVQPTA